ncbi:Ras-like protein family member 11A-like [Collichthys lucidus]|uniref:Ras-like protein family member 11A-like n=1 Tax=Collichthys lucidus TaxID=240159 RepID=A0A4V6ATR6_COLLU|nr:Ras-like protein family member 11A-like [Collichthys lucidus]
MLSVIYEIRATLICKLPLLTGGVYFEASARENHEGVHAAFLHLCQEVIRALGGGNGEKRRGGLHLARPKSPNMQELKRRFRQVLSSKVKSATTL